jgi:CheY-like chemotaxis protein
MHQQQKLKVAVVDDDVLMLNLICSMLHGLNYQAVPLDSAAALAEARHQQIFAALMLDLSMPDVDGFEMIYQLAGRPPVEPVIIFSSQSNNIMQAARLVCESLKIPVLGVLAKPFSIDELRLVLPVHLD